MTTTSDHPVDTDFEAELRAMLRRRATDVHPAPASVRHLHAGQMAAPGASTPALRGRGHPAMPLRRLGRRPVVAAAAAVVLLAGGVALAVAARSFDDGRQTAVGPVMADGRAFPTPGSEGWDPAAAPPVWPVVGEAALEALVAGYANAPDVDLGDPAAVVSAYLDAVASPLAIAAAQPTVSADGGTATADWDFTEEAEPEEVGPIYSGRIFLRRVDVSGRPNWVVVGAATRPTSVGAPVLSDVRFDGGRLRFIVASDTATGGAIAVRVRVDNVPVSVGDEPLPQGGPPDPASGELVRFDDTNRRELQLDVEPGDRVEILVRHVGGTWLSLAHMAVEIPVRQGAPPGPPTSMSPGTEAPPASDDAPAARPQGQTATTAGSETVVEHVEGTFRGTAHFSPTTGRCPTLDHVLDSTFVLSDGSTWRYHADYCGSIVGDLWTGTGTFTFTTSAGDTITGTFDSAARLPSDGEPYELRITGGTGSYERASGSCGLDNHLLKFEFGRQEQFGPFTCDITR
ncbi:MAG: hypothetical protein ACRD07_13075 [Acidimicrobiales bacterium]